MKAVPRAHVVFAHPKLSFGGGERVLIEQVAALADFPVDVSILFMEQPGQRDIEPELRERNPNIRGIHYAPSRWGCLRWLACNRPDLAVVCFHREFLHAMRYWRGMGGSTRLMVVIHENYPSQITYHRRFVPLIDAWMLDYDWSRDLLAHFPGRPVHVANPLYPRAQWPSWGDEERRAARESLGIDPDAAVIGYIGRMDVNKEPWSVLRVAEALQTHTRRPVHLLLAGNEVEGVSGRLSAAIGASSLGNRIHRLGRVPDVSMAFHALDLFVLASWQEGFFPLSIIEAMERGVPVLASTVGGIPTVLTEGQGGFFIQKPDNQQPITEAEIQEAVRRVAPPFDNPMAWAAQRQRAAERVQALIQGYDAAAPFRAAVFQTLGKAFSS